MFSKRREKRAAAETQARVVAYIHNCLAGAGLPLQPAGADAEPGVMVYVRPSDKDDEWTVWVGWNVAPALRQAADEAAFGTAEDVYTRSYAHLVLTAMTQAMALILTARGFSVSVFPAGGSDSTLQVVGVPADLLAVLEQGSS
ncbi:hypothetical protein [Streptomyces hokutonensis]|uniref:hypothetical protein n=1 Tax=Streptomyces hokutonensis TaxID=1306990 RepID=UPI000366ECE1|nr:hypothetical protein [Streptomyces hokutonensis]